MPHTVTSAESSIEYVEDRDQLDRPHTRQADLQNVPPSEAISLSDACNNNPHIGLF